MMSLRSQLRICYALWLLLGMTFLVLAVKESEIFLFALLGLFIVTGWFGMNLRCPNCDTPVLYALVRIGPITIPFVTSWIPKQCRNCKSSLR